MSPQNINKPPSSQPHSPTTKPLWKNSLIKLLQATINLLESTVVKLETPPQTDTVKTNFPKRVSRWSRVVGQIRSKLPAPLSKLSDTALTGILAGITVILVWTTITLSKQTQVASVPTPQPTITPTAQITKQETENTQQVIDPHGETPDLEENGETGSQTAQLTPPTLTADTTNQEETASLPQEESPTIDEQDTSLPQEESPTIDEQDTSLPQAQIKPEPQPVPLTPEQTLIVAVQNQVSEISDRFANGLIESIQANFGLSNLNIKINNDWYNLTRSEQDKLAAQIFQRGHELDFTHLEITDLQGKLIARNPVVGNQMVIFKRRK